MKPVYYNPFFEFNKKPVGAVAKGEMIQICINITEEYKLKNLKIILHADNSIKKIEHMLEEKERDNKHYIIYRTSFSIDEPGLYWYNFEFIDCYGRHYICGDDCLDAFVTDDSSRHYQLAVYDHFQGSLDWFKGGVMYQIFPDRFCKGPSSEYLHNGAKMHNGWYEHPDYMPCNGEILNNDYFGGNLQGIISRLDYLKELNVNTIYLNPIFLAFSNHRYDTADYLTIDPLLGDENDFKELCLKAKEKGIRIILDGVFNHTGSDSIYFNRNNRFPVVGAYQSIDSPYYSWYRFIKFPDRYHCWWDFKTLPSVSQNDEFVSFITQQVMKKWLRLGASGFRLDVVDELNSNFVMCINQSLKEEEKDNLLIGEVWEDASNKIAYGVRRKYFDGSELDSVMNYPLRSAIIDYIFTRNNTVLRNTVRSLINNYPKHVLDSLMNVLGTHDTSRILSVCGGVNFTKLKREEQAYARISPDQYETAIKKLKLAVVLQFTLPGVPCIFYGDEAGLEGYKDPFCRKTMPWDRFNADIFHFYRDLAGIRKDEDFKEGIYYELLDVNGVFGFRRNDIMVFVNNSDYEYRYEIKSVVIDMFSKEAVHNCILIEKMSYRILKRC